MNFFSPPVLNTTVIIHTKTKKVHSYTARYPVLRTTQSALDFTPGRPVHSNAISFSGKHSAILQLLHKDYSFTYPPLSVARYSFIQLSELWQRGTNETAKASKWQQEDSNPGSLE